MFFSEPEPARGQPLRVTEDIVRLVAPNPGPMTYHGTNTYLVSTTTGNVVIDPGPADDGHIRAILDAAGGSVGRILITHAHDDHVAGVQKLVAQTGAAVAGGIPCPKRRYDLQSVITDGDEINGLSVISTPGHARDHLCFQWGDIVFTGDHVLGWAATSILAPEGDAAAYHRSLQRLTLTSSRLFLPGHGPAIRGTRRFIEALMQQMAEREQILWAAVADRPAGTSELVARAYSNLSAETRSIAERTIEAQLVRLEQLGRVVRENEQWRSLR